MKTIRRDVLKRKVEAGKMEVKCNISLTDDYQFDNSINFGKTDWAPARIMHPKFEERTLYNGNKTMVCVDVDRKPGFYNLMECDFSGHGHACLEADGSICLYVHSNLSYQLREIS